MKLEIKHLAGYLPYGLKYQSEHIEGSRQYNMLGINCKYNRIDSDNDYGWIYIKGIKPILRPLSDLTKEIEVNGEKFVPIEELDYKPTLRHVSNYPSDFLHLQYIPHHSVEKLYEWNFDIYGLIELGLAIDINKLNK
jgi:hypothetical protein